MEGMPLSFRDSPDILAVGAFQYGQKKTRTICLSTDNQIQDDKVRWKSHEC